MTTWTNILATPVEFTGRSLFLATVWLSRPMPGCHLLCEDGHESWACRDTSFYSSRGQMARCLLWPVFAFLKGQSGGGLCVLSLELNERYRFDNKRPNEAWFSLFSQHLSDTF